MDLSIILGVISIIVGILPFFVKVNSKPLLVSLRVFSITLFTGFIVLFSSMHIGFPFDLRVTSPSDSLSDESSDIDINGDNNPVTVFKGDNNNVTNNIYPEKEDIIAIDTNDVTLDYAVTTDERFKSLYLNDPKYNLYTDLSDPNNKYYIEDNCVTIMNISNQSDHEIKINRYRIIIDEIEQNLEPVISTSLICGTNIDVNISNEGWSDISRLEIKVSDHENLLAEYYDEKDLIYEIPELKVGETKTLHILDKVLMKKIPDSSSSDVVLFPIFNFTSKEIVASEKSTLISINHDGPVAGFYGNLGTSVYGIVINTDDESYMEELSINEYIDSGEIKDIPICFFPDKSCKLRFYVEFDIFNGYETKTIKSEPRDLEFKISSLPYKP